MSRFVDTSHLHQLRQIKIRIQAAALRAKTGLRKDHYQIAANKLNDVIGHLKAARRKNNG